MPDDYDVVIDITSIADGNSGWPVLLSKELSVLTRKYIGQDDINGAIEKINLSQTFSVVAVLGLFNKGKSHIVKHLATVNLETSRKIHTKGLSFLQSRDPNCPLIFLDTAGTNAPLTNIASPDDRTLAEKYTTEIFLQDLAFGLSDSVIIVVNEITWPDQQFLKAMQRSTAGRRVKQLIVIHNFQSTGTLAELLEMWSKWVMGTVYGGSLQREGIGCHETVYCREDTRGIEQTGLKRDSHVVTLHFCIGDDNSTEPNLKKWNEDTYEVIKSKLQAINAPDRASFVDMFLLHMRQSLTYYCRAPTNLNFVPVQIEEESATRKESIKNSPEVVDIYSFLNAKPILSNREQGSFLVVANGDISVKADKVKIKGFHMLVAMKKDFQPHHDAFLNYDPKEEWKTHHGLYILVDLPGVMVESQNDNDGEQAGYEIDVYTEDPDVPEAQKELAVLLIEGNRKLSYSVMTESGTVHSEYEMNSFPGKDVLESEEAHFDERCHRPASKFKIKIPLPRSVSLERYEDKIEDGVLQVFCPRIRLRHRTKK